MAKGTPYATSLLQLIFNGTSIAGLADNTATSPVTTLYVALHTGDPTASGNQSYTEPPYTGYSRIGVVRSTAGWQVTGNSVSPKAAITFLAGTGGSGTVTNFSIGTALSGATPILYTGSITPSIVVGNGVTPILTTASTISET